MASTGEVACLGENLYEAYLARLAMQPNKRYREKRITCFHC